MGKRVYNKIPTNISDLKPNPRNPRTITDERLSMLERSMVRFGDLSGMVYNQRSGQLVGGHQRSKAFKNIEEVTIENRHKKATRTGTIAEGFILLEGERFAVRVVDWDETMERAANIAANKHGGKFDLQLLSDDLLGLDALNFDMELTGFTKTDLENLLAPTGEGEDVNFKTGAKELDQADFQDFDHSCPKCGFNFDNKAAK